MHDVFGQRRTEVEFDDLLQGADFNKHLFLEILRDHFKMPCAIYDASTKDGRRRLKGLKQSVFAKRNAQKRRGEIVVF